MRQRPGVYRMISPDGEILYVGKAKNLRTRLLGYFRAEYPADKSARIIREAGEVAWDYLPSEFAALHRGAAAHQAVPAAPERDDEARRAALRVHPHHDAGRRRSSWSCAAPGTTSTAPTSARSTARGSSRRRCASSTTCSASATAASTCRCTSRTRSSCPVAPARTPGCIRYEIGKCLGPCVGAVTQRQYRARFKVARDFLEGRHDSPLDDAAHRHGGVERAAGVRARRAAARQDAAARVAARTVRAAALRGGVAVVRVHRAGT